jgi:hypothetical protein
MIKIFLHKLRIRIILIVLISIITFHLIYLNSERYSSIYTLYDVKIEYLDLDETKYLIILNSIDDKYEKVCFLKNTVVSNVYGLPNDKLYYFYYSYLLIGILFVLSIKINSES